MTKIDSAIQSISNNICENIEQFADSNRGLLAQNVLAQLRNLVEHIAVKNYFNGENKDFDYEQIDNAIKKLYSVGNLKFLREFHKSLKISASHYTVGKEDSERLVLKYYEFLLKARKYVKDKFDLSILNNLSKIPLNEDKSLLEYYKKVVNKVNQERDQLEPNLYNDRCYIQKVKPIFVCDEIYYEVIFTVANDKVSKFDRIVAFTKLEILPNYAVRLVVRDTEIDILGKKLSVKIIDKWEVSIRQCELNHFSELFGDYKEIKTSYKEYPLLMMYLSNSGYNLQELVESPDEYYDSIKNWIAAEANVLNFFATLDKCRVLLKENAPGSNVLRYLLYELHNNILKEQICHDTCEKLSGLKLKYGCIPFDQMPYCTSLIGHNPRLPDLYHCISTENRDFEVLARIVRINTETNGRLFTPVSELEKFGDEAKIQELSSKYNERLYSRHVGRKLEFYKHHLYIKEYADDSAKIIITLRELSENGISNYANSVNSWLSSRPNEIDDCNKEMMLKSLFAESRVALIYGAAGTGKTTTINYVAEFFNDKKKLFLTDTNPALENLRRNITASDCRFSTITSFLSQRTADVECDLLIIDESSTVSNSEMRRILDKAEFKLLLLVGDVFQIESIRFGNWFNLSKGFLDSRAIFELKVPFRTTDSKLIETWDKVRNLDKNILEHIVRNGYSASLDDSIFEYTSDEIILCLNYDGVYGINSINSVLQSSNSNPLFQWGIGSYKVGDPVLFNESRRFAPLIYNNSKGKIVDIIVFQDKIQFDVEIEKSINGMDVEEYSDLELVGESGDHSIVRFFVKKLRSTDEDDLTSDSVVPFQVAYAVSIHKAQGLEYNSVKVIITDEIGELITHNIFYTAITRTKNKLKIYWTPEMGQKVLSSLSTKNIGKDKNLLASLYGL